MTNRMAGIENILRFVGMRLERAVKERIYPIGSGEDQPCEFLFPVCVYAVYAWLTNTLAYLLVFAQVSFRVSSRR